MQGLWAIVTNTNYGEVIMPFEQRWVPAPKDETLLVFKVKPVGIYYECKYCGGWIEGSTNRYREDTLSILAGRRGTVEYCRRCGQEINFFGVQA